MRRVLPPMLTYAQNFEDVLLRRALSEIERGFYVDIGAFHPVVDSVTCWFYSQGWSGINVEPNPRFNALLNEHRPHDLNLAAAVAGTSGELELHLLDGLSTTVGAVAEQHARTGHSSKGITRVPTLSLEDLFARHVGPRTVDFLKIDVEGAEATILEAYSFDTVRPRLVVVEATEPDSVALTSAAWEAGLLAKGYLFCYFDGLNRYFVRTEDAWRKALFDAPPNVFDQFRLPFTDRRVDYVASARTVLDQVPEGGVQALIAERDRLRAERDQWAGQAQAYVGERDRLVTSLAAEQVGHEATRRAERMEFAQELAALTLEHDDTIAMLKIAHDAAATALRTAHDEIQTRLSSDLSGSEVMRRAAESQIADLTARMGKLSAARDGSLLESARLQIKLDALRLDPASPRSVLL